jgi:hypothetical protein
LPYLTPRFQVSYYGGEPLLSFAALRELTDFVTEQARRSGRRAGFGLTTNGSLISRDAAAFFGHHRFRVTVSFDGPAQDKQRSPGSSGRVLAALRALRKDRRIRLGVNSVFTPATVGDLARTCRFLLRLDIPTISFALSVLEPWSPKALDRLDAELETLRRVSLARFQRRGDVPLDFFRGNGGRGVFACAGGEHWLTLFPDGRLWGCPLFGDYFRGKGTSAAARAFGFGAWTRFRRDPERIHARHLAHYRRLSQDNFRTDRGACFLCPELERCEVCPVTAVLAGAEWGRVPASVCAIQRVKSRHLRLFREAKP